MIGDTCFICKLLTVVFNLLYLIGEGTLTSEALKKHNAFLGGGRSRSEESQDDDGDETFGGTFKTFQTFASDWTECSNVSFNR